MAIYTLDRFLGSFTVWPLEWLHWDRAHGAVQLHQQTQPGVTTGTSPGTGWGTPTPLGCKPAQHPLMSFIPLIIRGWRWENCGCFYNFRFSLCVFSLRIHFLGLPHLAPLPAESGLFLYVLFPNLGFKCHRKPKGQLQMPKEKQRISQIV